MFFSSTHDESAPDTLGITGPAEVMSRVVPCYVEFLIDHTASAIKRAAAKLRRANLRYGSVRPNDMTDDTRVPYGYHGSTEARGEAIARWSVRALATGSWSRSDAVKTKRTTFSVPLENARFALGGSFGVIAGKDGYIDGRKITHNAAGIADPFEIANEFQTDVAWYRIGDADFVSAPGELFPFTYARSFGGPADQDVPDGAAPPPWIMARPTQRYRVIAGLDEDMVALLFPKSNAEQTITELRAIKRRR